MWCFVGQGSTQPILRCHLSGYNPLRVEHRQDRSACPPKLMDNMIFCLKTDFTFVGLQTPPLCELVVGGEPQCWSEGHCLLVDDSFLHTVSHKGQ